jgi:hypothetical protein
MVDVWVCPHCEVLLGIYLSRVDNNLVAVCSSCGIIHDVDKVDFINPKSVINLIDEIDNIMPEKLLVLIQYKWLASATVGLVIEEDYEFVQSLLDFDLEEKIDELREKLGLDITIIYDLD